jgi:hypothetical protein
LRLTGTWIGGESDRTDIKAALAWASVPSVVSLCLWLPAILLFGSENFTAFTPRIRSQPLLLIPYFAFTILQVVLGVWGFVILCNTIAEVQEFGSAWKGLLNMFLAVVVVIVPLILFLLAMIMLSIA